jgi:hypothetical protein
MKNTDHVTWSKLLGRCVEVVACTVAEMSPNTIGLALGVAVVGMVAAVAFWWLGASSKATRDTEQALADQRAASWSATVTGREIQEVGSQGPISFGTTGKLKHLTVYYRRDDGVRSNVQAYENDAMRGTYTGPLAYYREAPGWDELSQWRDGDRLFKPKGEIFPHRLESGP